jgi:arsenate reductase
MLSKADMTTNVLILCTHNAARSILAEAMLAHWAERLGKPVRAFSAGSRPSGRVDPHALRVLGKAGIDTSSLRSKSWDEFTRPDAPTMRLVITVCDDAAGEPCPYWPGAPIQGHWGHPDPSAAPEPAKAAGFELTRQAIGYRMLQLLAYDLDQASDADLRALLATIAGR